MNRRAKKALRKLRGLLAGARKKPLNEADTRNLVDKFLESVLGYELVKEVTAEERVEHRAADYAVRINKKLAFLVEIKAIQTRLKDNHVFQVKNYAASKGVPWCLLTNGAEFRLYHVDFSEAVKHQLVFEINIIDDDFRDVVDKISYLTRRSMAKNEVEKLWRRQRSLSEEGLLEALLSPRVLKAMRRHIQAESRERVKELDIARGFRRMFSEQLYEAYERLETRLQRKKRRARRVSKPLEKSVSTGQVPTPALNVHQSPGL